MPESPLDPPFPRAVQIIMGHQAFAGPLQTRLHQRAVAIEVWADANRHWGRWWHGADPLRATLAIYWESAGGSRARPHVRIEEVPAPPGGVAQVYVYVFDRGSDYSGLTDREAVTLKFLSGFEALLRGVAERYERPHPDHLPRTRREREWLAAGHQPPPASKFLAGPFNDTRRHVVALPKAAFWQIVNGLDGDVARRERRLRSELRALPLAQLAGFHARYVQMTGALYRRDVWDAAEEVIGWASDDVFTNLRIWIVAQGQATYEAVRDDPSRLRETLIGLDDEAIGAAEGLASVADELYLNRAGRSMSGDYIGIELHEPNQPPT